MTTPIGTLTVFINERLVHIPAGTGALEAVRLLDPALAARIEGGEGYLTDGRGIRLTGAEPLTGGAIVRAVIRAGKAAEPDADA